MGGLVSSPRRWRSALRWSGQPVIPRARSNSHLALGVAMVFSAWQDRSEARKLSGLLDRAQAERFFRSIPELHERNRGPATSSDLTALLDRSKTEGLRYLVEYDRFGHAVAEAGSHIGSERPTPADASGVPTVIGDRVRVTFIPPRAPTQPGQLHSSPPPPPFNDEPGDQSQPRSPPLRPPPPPPPVAYWRCRISSWSSSRQSRPSCERARPEASHSA